MVLVLLCWLEVDRGRKQADQLSRPWASSSSSSSQWCQTSRQLADTAAAAAAAVMVGCLKLLLPAIALLAALGEKEEREEEEEEKEEDLNSGSKLESHLVTRDFDVSSEAQLILALLLVILSHNKLC